jgi:hypothetical protein
MSEIIIPTLTTYDVDVISLYTRYFILTSLNPSHMASSVCLHWTKPRFTVRTIPRLLLPALDARLCTGGPVLRVGGLETVCLL